MEDAEFAELIVYHEDRPRKAPAPVPVLELLDALSRSAISCRG
ncbi:MAG: hypothetical protein ACYDEY_12610 [Acidimicrobiales bacterium]